MRCMENTTHDSDSYEWYSDDNHNRRIKINQSGECLPFLCEVRGSHAGAGGMT